MNFIDFIKQPWPWWVAGPLIGLTVPLLLIIGNKSFGVSASLRHICAVCFPANISFFKYDWRKEIWNLIFATGIILGAFLATQFFANPDPVALHPSLGNEFQQYGINVSREMVPPEIFNWDQLLTLKGFVMIVIGGFLVGFGTRYAGGCTSGHSIMGLSNLQFPSLVATLCFMAGGFLAANFIIPLILKL